MAPPYVGEIRLFAGKFAPAGWAFCDGGLLSIDENETLYNLIGTTYGGDGEMTFAVPDLRGRVPVHQGNNCALGEQGGTEEVALTVQQIPPHNHFWVVSEAPATALTPQNNVPGEASKRFYVAPSSVSAMAPQAMAATGGGQPHSNLQPFLCVQFIISLFGIFPSQT